MSKYTVFSVTLFLLLLGSTSIDANYGEFSSPDCKRAFEEKSCDFYKYCVEDQIPCGEGEYALSYGLKYCESFTNTYDLFNDIGKIWVNGTRDCLIRSLYPLLNATQGSCSKVKEFAYETHVSCYLENNFCEMMSENKAAIYWVYDIFNDFLFSKDWQLVWKQVIYTMFQCKQPHQWAVSFSDIGLIYNNFYENWISATGVPDTIVSYARLSWTLEHSSLAITS